MRQPITIRSDPAMNFDESAMIAALRGSRPLDAICRDAGCSVEEFEAERDAYLQRHATLADQTVAGPVGGPVEIKRDRAGVPHIYADSTRDLYFGLGFAMAQDRLWQMDRLRRRALGRQAEILGSAYLASDIAHLTVGIDQMAQRDAEAMDAA